MQEKPQKNEESSILVKKLILVLLFLIIAPLVLGTSIASLVTISNTQKDSLEKQLAQVYQNPMSGVQVYASLPTTFPSISGEVISESAQVGLIKKYLIENDSPLAPYAEFIVDTSDKYGLDYRLITAIAQKESGLCRVIPEGSHNCWGWGIHSRGTLMFDSYEEGIETVSLGLKENYLDLGYLTLEEIMSKYTPLSKGSWAEGVGFYMNQIADY